MADRVLAARFGYKAVELLQNDADSCAIGIKDNKVITVSFDDRSIGSQSLPSISLVSTRGVDTENS